MFTSRKSAKFMRVVLTIVVTLLTFGVLARPQGSAQAVDYLLTDCNVSSLVNAYNTAIATAASDSIFLQEGCIYTFTTANASGRALANLPGTSTAGSLTIVGSGASIRRTGSNDFGFIETLSGSGLYIYNTIFSGFNSGSDLGGVIEAGGTAFLNVETCRFDSNTSANNGGAIWSGNSTNVYINSSSFYYNNGADGGAIRSFGGMYIRWSSFYGNTASGSGGAVNLAGGDGVIYNTTFGVNSANGDGGAIKIAPGAYTFRNNTIYENRADDDSTNNGDGGGVYMSGTFTTPVVMHNTVIAANLDDSTTGTLYRDALGVFASSSTNNFIGTNTGLTGITNNVNSNRVGTPGTPLNPLLGLITNRAGISENLYYYVPLSNSPLINGGNNAQNTDNQDGRLYRRVIHSVVDIGAIEFKRADSPVVVNPANQGWLFRYTNSAGPVELSFLYGQGLSDYQPFVGDWNGDDTDTQGIYTRFTSSNIGVFALSNAFNSFDAATLPSFAYTDANANWLPTSGDWDGNGADSVGAYRVTDGIWVLTNNNSSTTPSYPAFSFGGGAGVLPLSGDWDGDGDNSIGIYNFSNSRFILSNEVGSSATVNFNFVYGAFRVGLLNHWAGHDPPYRRQVQFAGNAACHAPCSLSMARM